MDSENNYTQDSPSFRDRLKSDRFIYFDGGMGTLLHSRGLPAGMSPEIWGITRPDVLVKAHREYIEAGADIIKTNTFGGNGFRCPSSPPRSAMSAAPPKAAEEGYTQRST